MTIVLPIYYTQTFKTKNNKTFLVGMNWYRNSHYHLSNQVKAYYHDLVKSQIDDTKITKGFTLEINLYYKNPTCDGANIAALMEKYILDALQENNVIINDNVQYHFGSTWNVIEQDKNNPRAEITVKEN